MSIVLVRLRVLAIVDSLVKREVTVESTSNVEVRVATRVLVLVM